MRPNGDRSASRDLAGFEAGGAYVEAVTIAGADSRPDGLNVRVPPAMCPPMRVRDRHAEARPLAADVAHGSHVTHSLGLSRGWYARLPGGRGEAYPAVHGAAHRGRCGSVIFDVDSSWLATNQPTNRVK